MPKSVKAIAVLNSPKCKGTVNIIEMKNGVKFDVNLTNLTLESTVFISMKQEVEDGCKSCCAHFNPLNKEHGGPVEMDGKNRHLGDLGNITADKNGNCVQTITDKYLQLGI